jgi:hypothetical protein
MILDSDSDSPLGPFSVYDLFPCSSPGRRPLQALTLSNITFLREDLSPAGLDNLVDVATAPTPQNSAIVLRWRAHLSTLVTVDGAGTYQFVPTLSSSASELVVAHCRARGIRPQHNHRLTLSIQGLSRYYAWRACKILIRSYLHSNIPLSQPVQIPECKIASYSTRRTAREAPPSNSLSKLSSSVHFNTRCTHCVPSLFSVGCGK